MLRLLLCFFCNHTECLHFEITRKILYRSALFALLPSSGKCLLYVEMSCFWRTFLFMSSKKENDCVKKLKSCCLMERTSHQGSWQWTVNWRAFLWSCTDFYVTETQLRPCEHFSWIPWAKVSTRSLLPARKQAFTSWISRVAFQWFRARVCISAHPVLLKFFWDGSPSAFPSLPQWLSDVRLATECNTGDSSKCWSVRTALLRMTSASMKGSCFVMDWYSFKAGFGVSEKNPVLLPSLSWLVVGEKWKALPDRFTYYWKRI